MKRILAYVDKSSLATEVHRVAIGLARNSRGKVRFFRVIEGAGELPETNDSLIGEAKGDLEELTRNDPPDLVAGLRAVVSETPWKAICDAAREENVDLIVIGGASGRGRVARSAGTTATNVVNHADRSVLVVRSR